MKKLFLFILASFSTVFALGNHITGGEMFYTVVDSSNGNYIYRVTLKLYRDCNSTGAPLDLAAPIAIFNTGTKTMVWSGMVQQSDFAKLNLGSPNPCIQNPPIVCYEVGYYEFTTIPLPPMPQGYTITYQRCCRITGINNLVGSSSVGATYTAQIPGTSVLSTAPFNNSAHFRGADTVIICANNSFCYDFGAVDPDSPVLGDSLTYSFLHGFRGRQYGDACAESAFCATLFPCAIFISI